MEYFLYIALKQYTEINYDMINPFSSLQIHMIIYTLHLLKKSIFHLGKNIKFPASPYIKEGLLPLVL